MRNRSNAGGWSGLLVSLLWPLTAQGADLKSEFLARYEPAASVLEEAYSNVTIRAVSRRVGWAAYEHMGGRRTTRLVVRKRGTDVRVDETRLAEEGGNVAESECVVRVVRAKGGFRAARGAMETEFQLQSLDPPLDPSKHAILGEHRFMRAPYGWLGMTIRDFLKDPPVRVTRLREITVSGERLVELFWEDAESSQYRGTGWFRFSPDRQWVVREFAAWAKDMTPEKLRSDPNYSIARGVVEYGEERAQVPSMSRVVYWHERGPGQPRENLETIEVEQLTFGEVPESEFTLASLGIATPQVKTNSARFLVFFAGGVLCLVFGFFLARRLKSRPA